MLLKYSDFPPVAFVGVDPRFVAFLSAEGISFDVIS